MKKLNAKGFAHHVAIMAVVVVAIIGGIGSYIYLNSSSAATRYTPQQVCGSGYTLRKTSDMAGGKAYLLINSSTKMACGTVISTTNYGTSKPMRAQIQIVNSTGSKVLKSGNNDSANYKYYAGPSKLSYASHLGQKSTAQFRVIGKIKTVSYSPTWKMTNVGTLGTTASTTTKKRWACASTTPIATFTTSPKACYKAKQNYSAWTCTRGTATGSVVFVDNHKVPMYNWNCKRTYRAYYEISSGSGVAYSTKTQTKTVVARGDINPARNL